MTSLEFLAGDESLSLRDRLIVYLNTVQDEIDATEKRYQFLQTEIQNVKRALAGIERAEYKERLASVPSEARKKLEANKPEPTPAPKSTSETKRSYVRVTPEMFRDFAKERKEFKLLEAAEHFGCSPSTIGNKIKEAIKKGIIEWVGSPKSNSSYLRYIKPEDTGPIQRLSVESPEDIAKKMAITTPSGSHVSIGKMTSNKEIRKILNKCRQQGCTIETLGNQHLRVTNKEGISLQISSSPSRQGAIDAIKRGLRKKLNLSI